MNRILINATQPEEIRVAMVEGQRLFNFDIETRARKQTKSNIYKGKITRVEPSLEAAFVAYGAEKHGFLPIKDVVRSYFHSEENVANNEPNNGGRVQIKDALKEGQEIIIQVDKEERGNKGAALTTFVSLAGRYLVLMPNNPRAGGVSRRIEGDERSEAREALSNLNIPDGMGVILRTAGVGKITEELAWDLDYLLRLWEAIQNSANEREAPFLIYQESNVIIRAIRDYFRDDIEEILIDDVTVFQEAIDFMQLVMPQFIERVRLYQDTVPLFTRYQIESQIETAFQREVRLPSGGAIVIDHTEALIAIDINSARSTKGEDIEETALTTNLEAVDEVSRQLRLRDLGGLIVIDFIDMISHRNQREVENRIKEVLKMDRARVQVGRISRFGLLEMSRQRLRPSLGESSQITCPRCHGHGTVRGVESLALSVMRLIEEEAMKDRTGRIIAQVPVNVGTYLLNEKRQQVINIENRQDVGITIVPNPHIETPNFELQRVRLDDKSDSEISYKTVEAPEISALPYEVSGHEIARQEEAAVKGVIPQTPAPMPKAPPGPGFMAWMRNWWSSLRTVEKSEEEEENTNAANSRRVRRGPQTRTPRTQRKEGDARRPANLNPNQNQNQNQNRTNRGRRKPPRKDTPTENNTTNSSNGSNGSNA